MSDEWRYLTECWDEPLSEYCLELRIADTAHFLMSQHGHWRDRLLLPIYSWAVQSCYRKHPHHWVAKEDEG